MLSMYCHKSKFARQGSPASVVSLSTRCTCVTCFSVSLFQCSEFSSLALFSINFARLFLSLRASVRAMDTGNILFFFRRNWREVPCGEM